MDIEALSILRERRDFHLQLQSPSAIGDNFDEFKNRVLTATASSVKCVDNVNAYCVRIKEELLDFRKRIKDFNIEVAEMMQKVVTEGFVNTNKHIAPQAFTVSNMPHVDFTHGQLKTVKREYFEMEKAKRIKESQQLLKQQQDLLDLISQTENIIGIIDIEGELTLGQLDNLKANVNKYVKGLETDKERRERKRKEEEREARIKKEKEEIEERKRKEKAEADRRKKEEEQRRKAAERERQNEIQRMKQSKNWPLHEYLRTSQHCVIPYHGGINCVVSAMAGPNGIEKENICTNESADHNDLFDCLKKGETLLTDLISIKANGLAEIDLEYPVLVFVPHKPTRDRQRIIMKTRVDEGPWTKVKCIEDKPKKLRKDIMWLGTAVERFRLIEIVVILLPHTEKIKLTSRGGRVKSKTDRNTIIHLMPGCVKNDFVMDLRVTTIPLNRLKERKDLDNICVATKFHQIGFEEDSNEDMNIQVHVDAKQKIVDEENHMKAFEKCKSKLATDITFDDVMNKLLEADVVPDSFMEEVQGSEDSSMKIKKLLDYFSTSSSCEFETFLQVLEDVNHSYLAQMIRKTKEQITDSDLEGDIKILRCNENDQWDILDSKDAAPNKDNVNIVIGKGQKTCCLIGVVVPITMHEECIKRSAQKLRLMSVHKPLNMVIRQNRQDLHEVRVVCAQSQDIRSVITSLESRGFTEGPEEVFEMWICDGEEIEYSTRENLKIDMTEDERKVTVRYFEILGNNEVAFRITEQNKKDFTRDMRYFGYIVYTVIHQNTLMLTRGQAMAYIPVGDDIRREEDLRLAAIEKEKIEREERKRKEKEETERKRAEKERLELLERQRREKEEKERKQKELEAKRRAEIERIKDPQNWWLYEYQRSVTDTTEIYHNNISCLVSVIKEPHSIDKDDLITSEIRDQEEFLKCVTKGEILLSDIIELNLSNHKQMDFAIPAWIYVPYCPCPDDRTVYMKVRVNKDEWTIAKSTKGAPKNFKQSISLIGMEISKLTSVDIVIVSRPTYQCIMVTSNGGSFKSTVDNNTVITVPPGCVDTDTQMELRVKQIPAILTKGKDNDNIRVVTKFHQVKWQGKTAKDSTVQIRVDDDNTIEGSRIHMKAIENCKKKLASDINLSLLLKQLRTNGAVSDDLAMELEELQDERKRIDRLLDYFVTCSTSDFEAFIQGLEDSDQNHLAKLIRKARDDMDDMGSDFEGELKMLTASGESKKWEIVDQNSLQRTGQYIHIPLQKDDTTLSVVGLVVPKSMLDSDIKRAAQKTQEMSVQSPLSLIISQQNKDPHRFCAQVAIPNRVSTAIQSLGSRGYKSVSTEEIVVGICEGDSIAFNTSGNIVMSDENKQDLKRVFANMDNGDMQFTLNEKDKRGQLKKGKFFGKLQYTVGNRESDLVSKGYVDVYLPLGNDYKRYAPIRMDAHLVAAFKYIAIVLAEENREPDAFLKDLAKQDYRALDGRVKREVKDGEVRSKVEAFLLNWSARRPKTEDKVKAVMDAVQRNHPEIHDKVQSFINIYSPQSGCLSNKSIKEMATYIGEQWEALGIYFNMSDKTVHDIKTQFDSAHDRAVNLLDLWRISDDAIRKGNNVIKHLKNTMECAKCSPQAVNFVTNFM